MLLLFVGCEASKIGLGNDTGNEGDTDTDTEEIGDPPPATAQVYVSSDTSLYTWDPDTTTLDLVASFTDDSGAAIGYFADIAIDDDGQLFGTVGGYVYRVDAATGVSVYEGAVGDTGTGLTVLPDGRLLVAGGALTAWELDSGATEEIYASGVYSTSGDIVAVPDGTLHWSVLGASGDDWVVIDPNTGTLLSTTVTGASQLWGVAYADGALYGFSSNGTVYGIEDGVATAIVSTGVAFYGAATNPVTW